ETVSYTVQAGDTTATIAALLLAALRANANISGALGPGIMSNALVIPNTTSVAFNQLWPLCSTSACTAITTSNTTITIYGGGDVLEVNPVFAFGRYVAGRNAQVGDLLSNLMCVGGDSSTGALAQQYFQLLAKIADASPTTARGGIHLTSGQLLGCGLYLSKGLATLLPGGGLPDGGDLDFGAINAGKGFYVHGKPIATPRESMRIADPQVQNKMIDRRIFGLRDLGIASWQTILTITPSTTTNVYVQGHIEIKADAATGATGMGSRSSVWDYRYANGAPSVSLRVADSSSGNAIPQVRLTTSGSSILVQLASSDGVHSIESGIAEVTSYLPDAAAYADPLTWAMA
ncbi:hypothetical protein ACYOEI_24710, partial [Singulisphaera rosea]